MRKNRSSLFILATLLLLLNVSLLFSQNTVGFISKEATSAEGYVLFAPLFSTTTFLIDKCGKQVHSWQSKYLPGRSVYLLPNGDLLRSAKDSNKIFIPGAGRLEQFNWDGKLIWDYTISDSIQCQHHDVEPLPNGNILVLVWEKISRSEAIKNGRNPELLGDCIWSEKIIEIKPLEKHGAKIVWEWRAWDHLVQDFDYSKLNYGSVKFNPELINLNFGASTDPDWLHFNSIYYNPFLNEIIISNRNFNEIMIIDHSTSIKESKGHMGGKHRRGGDLVYRWGNPRAYNTGTIQDQKLFGQHSASWIEKGFWDEGKIIVFNNGIGRPNGIEYSSIDVIAPIIDKNGKYRLAPDKAYYPNAPSWSYQTPTQLDFYSKNVSNAQRLSNGNTLICSGEHGQFFEVDPNMNVVWRYINPLGMKGNTSQGNTASNNQVYRCTFYEFDFPAFKGKQLSPGKPVEAEPKDYTCTLGD